MGDVSRRLLKATQQWYLHPLHVPVILLNIFFDHAAWEVNRLCIEVERFEFLSRDAGIGSLQSFDTITTELQYIQRDLDFLQSLAKFLLETMEFLEKKIFDRENPRKRDDGISDMYRKYVYQTNPHMEEKLNNVLHLIENNLSTATYLQARTSDSLDFVKGKIALRDNDSNREDADSNKAMSFLQMVFLPATFIAAILSMSFFNLSASPPTVSSYIWVFWVIALILTALTLGAYFFWKWRTKKKIEAEEAELKKREKRWGVGMRTDGTLNGSASGTDGESGGGRRKKRRRRRREKYNDSGGDDDAGGGGKKKKEKPELVSWMCQLNLMPSSIHKRENSAEYVGLASHTSRLEYADTLSISQRRPTPFRMQTCRTSPILMTTPFASYASNTHSCTALFHPVPRRPHRTSIVQRDEDTEDEKRANLARIARHGKIAASNSELNIVLTAVVVNPLHRTPSKNKPSVPIRAKILVHNHGLTWEYLLP